MTDELWTQREMGKPLVEGVEEVQIKVKSIAGESSWIPISAAAFERMIHAVEDPAEHMRHVSEVHG